MTSHPPRIFASGLAMGESPRWCSGQLWLSDWGVQELVSYRLDGRRETRFRVPFELPFCFDHTPDGQVLLVAGREGQLWRGADDGSLEPFARLTERPGAVFNEIVIDGRGNAYVNGTPGIVLVTPDGRTRPVAEPLAFPNGMALSPDQRTLIVAESHGQRLTAFDIGRDGGLSNRRSWAELPGSAPDGICLDAEGAVWYADVPHRCCVRVREGGEVLDTVLLDRGGFACMLGGPDGRTLFIVATEWRGMDRVQEVAQARTGQVLTVRVAVPGARLG